MASEIWSRAAQLEGSDQKVARQITDATADLGNVGFAPGHKDSGVQLVDFNKNQPPPFAPWDTPDGKPPPGGGLSPALQQMLLGGNPAKLTGQGLVDNLQQFVQSLPENDPRTAYLRGEVADLRSHVSRSLLIS